MKEKAYAQLYSIVRQEREGHLEAFRRFAEIGYDGVELLGNNTNGLSFEDYKKYLKDLGLKAIASHNLHNDEDYDFAAKLGLKYDIVAGCDAVRDEEKLKRICEEWNQIGRHLEAFGMKAVIHNHGEEFCWMNEEKKEKRIYDYIAENTDPKTVGFELDVGWVVRAGLDPVEYITRYAGRMIPESGTWSLARESLISVRSWTRRKRRAVKHMSMRGSIISLHLFRMVIR